MTELELKKQRERRAKNGNLHTKRYEKTAKGYLMRAYRNMKSRVTGVQKHRAHLYKGLPILDKNDFYEWAMKDLSFMSLFLAWTASGYDRKISPSIDRIDPTKGYLKENIRWVTHSQNSKNTRRWL